MSERPRITGEQPTPSAPPGLPTTRPRLPTIRGRLGRLLLGVALAWGLAVSAVVWLAVRYEVDELLDDTLQTSAEVLRGLLTIDDSLLPALQRALADTPSAARQVGKSGGAHEEGHFAWQLVDAQGVVLARSARAPLQPLGPLAISGFFDAASGWRVYGTALAGERWLYVAQTTEERLEAQAEVAVSSVWAALGVGLISALWLRRRLARELQPVQDLAPQLSRYEPLTDAAALAPPQREELRPVHDAVIELGRRLARRVANERAFSAHAAHALRTPLAGIEAQLAVAIRESPPDLRPRLQKVRDGSARLSRVVAALLALFRSGMELQRRPLELETLLQTLPLPGIALQVPPGLVVQADPDLLSAALINLLDNSVRHGASSAEVQLVHEGGAWALQLGDDGAGMAPDRRREVVDALQGQHYEGKVGLGLMLADLVARAHGGRMELPESARGFAVRLWLGDGTVQRTSSAPPLSA